jgi:hypothetical protein
MEKKKTRLTEIIIIALVLVCVALILINLSALVSTEIVSLNSGAVLEETSSPTPFIRPTLPADYTPEPIIDA